MSSVHGLITNVEFRGSGWSRCRPAPWADATASRSRQATEMEALIVMYFAVYFYDCERNAGMT